MSDTTAPEKKRLGRPKGSGTKARAAKEKKGIAIPPIQLEKFDLVLEGDSGLISHAWSEKAKKQIRDKQQKKAKGGRGVRDYVDEFLSSLYWLTPRPAIKVSKDGITPEKKALNAVAKAKFGFPAVAFKNSAVDACSHIADITKVLARGAFHVLGEMVEIETDEPPVMREDMVRIGMGTSDLRYRGEFLSWRVTLRIQYNKGVISKDQITNLFNVAGFAVGLGEWRPAKNGNNGMFHVVKTIAVTD